ATRVSCDNGFSILRPKLIISDSENIHFDTCSYHRHLAFMGSGIPGVVWRANAVRTVSIDSSGKHFVGSREQRSLHRLQTATVIRDIFGQGDIVEHRADIEQLGVEAQASTLTCKCAK